MTDHTPMDLGDGEPTLMIPAAAREALERGEAVNLDVLGATATPADHEYGLEWCEFSGWRFTSVTNFPASWYQAGGMPPVQHFARRRSPAATPNSDTPPENASVAPAKP